MGKEKVVGRMKKGIVYLVGSGPGDPELITVKGLKLIKKADTIIYDFLVDKKLLSFAKKTAKLICAGKSPLYHSMEQSQINRLLVDKAKEGKLVVRLKNGDPFIFGRGAEEANYLAEQNIPYEVIPGLSSATAVPASCGVPLTHRDYASSVAIITGHRKYDKDVKFVNADTLVFLMAVTNLEKITKELIKKGKSPDTPCIVIEKGTFENQRVIEGNLGNIYKKSKRKKISPPAVFVVGEVVNLRSVLNRNKKKILFTGIEPQRFKHLGKISHEPMIKIVPLEDYREVEREVERIDKYHWIIFTSRYGVKYLLDVVNRMKKDIGRIRTCCIGKTTANKLKEYSIRVTCVPQKESSQGIMETLKKFDLKDKNILIPRSNLSSNYLPRALQKRGGYVKTIPVYRNIPPSRCKKIDLSQIDEIIFTSPSGIKNFMAKYKDIPERIKIKCIGDVTLSKLKSYGFCGEVIK
jgi:uroporphyrinogen III methyltransferase/synthase